MSKLQLFFISFVCLTQITQCKITSFYNSEFEYNNDLEPESKSVSQSRFSHVSDQNSKLWELKISNNLNSTRLRRGSFEEEADFDNIIDPMRHVLETRLLAKKFIDNEEEITKNWKQLQEETLTSINRFIMSIRNEPDLLSSGSIENEEFATLTFYIKEYFTILLVSYKKEQWRYIIGPPTPLPKWLYESHTNVVSDGDEAYVEIPTEVKFKIFQALAIMFKKFSSYIV